jgi:hypothetical protein
MFPQTTADPLPIFAKKTFRSRRGKENYKGVVRHGALVFCQK